jgi:nitronate monooxygenase
MAGGPGTPELVAAVGAAGGLGFLAGGYTTASALRAQIGRTRRLTTEPFGVNLFVPRPSSGDDVALAAYLAEIEPEAARLGVALGPARWDDDDFAAKLGTLVADPVPVVSFTFGCPTTEVVADLHDAGSAVVVTVTTPAEAIEADTSAPDALCVQGTEAGGHQGAFSDATEPDESVVLLQRLRAVAAVTRRPLIGAGGLMGGEDIAAVLAVGGVAAQLGTAFLCCPESGTSAVHRAALSNGRFSRTALTRAFSGRWARGLRNRFMVDHPGAPPAYPEIINATAPMRRAAGAAGDLDRVNLWAGTGFARCGERPAGELVARLVAEALE